MPWTEHGSGYAKKGAEKGKGGFIGNPKQYEKLRGKGMSKEQAARITNASSFSKGRVSSVNDKVLIPLGVAATGGIAANQVPQNRHDAKKARKKAEKKAEEVFKSDNAFATKMYNLVMKMDPDEARFFTEMVVMDVVTDTIDKNLRTLQRHVDEVVAKRTARVKKALVSSVAKNDDQQALAYAQALSVIEKASSLNPYDYGYRFQESDFRRDPGSGQFRAKVRVKSDQPIDRKTAESLGIPEFKGLQDHQRAQYQQEYLQIAQFLDNIAGTSADQNAVMHIQDKSGQRYVKTLNGRPAPGDWNPRTERVTAVEARPANLTAGGAAFSVTNALGAGGAFGPTTSDTINRVDQHLGQFSREWGEDTDPELSNARLYSNVKAGSDFLNRIAPYGSHAQVAAKFGQFVGSHGPDAEKVFGPSIRRSAYRYRGVEKAPDADVVRDYNNAAKNAGDTRTPTQRAQEAREYTARFNRDETRMKKEKAARTGVPEDAVQLTNAERKTLMRGATTYTGELSYPLSNEAKSVALSELADHLRERMPSRDLYGLQLDAGTTPPSEGFIVDKDGHVVTQAVGYGDDHYLPFNLKNLKGLRGGEYIRTRSVGGPTSEDIYTGLLAGAQKITVISRSGTFTIDFAEDFKGGRRYNDKAARMVGRYQKILDSVQSEQIDRQGIAPEMRSAIRNDVREKFKGFPASEIKAEIVRRESEFKENPDLMGDDDAALERQIMSLTQDMPEGEAARVAGQIRNKVQEDKDFKYRLNGKGYEAALGALQEQFPYYFTSHYESNLERDRFESEKDRGYVEPGRNRPTLANAGWHGTSTNKGSAFERSQSASHANYQRGRYGTGKPVRQSTTQVAAETPAEEGKPGTTAEGPKKSPTASAAESISNAQHHQEYVNTLAEMQQKIKVAASPEALAQAPDFMRMDEASFKTFLEKPENGQKWAEYMKAGNNFSGVISNELLLRYNHVTNQIDRKPYDKTQGLIVGNKPWLFTDDAYKGGAEKMRVDQEVIRLNRTKPVSTDKPLATLSDDELKTELVALGAIDSILKAITPDTDLDTKKDLLDKLNLPDTPGAAHLLSNPKEFERHIETVQKQRSLNLNRTDRTVPGAQAPEASGGNGAPAPPATPSAGPAAQLIPVRDGGPPAKKTAPPRKSGDASDHRARAQGAHDFLAKYRSFLDKVGEEVPEKLDAALADSNATLAKPGPVLESDYNSLVNSPSYKAAAQMRFERLQNMTPDEAKHWPEKER